MQTVKSAITAIAVLVLTNMITTAQQIIDLDEDFNTLTVGNYISPAGGGSDSANDIGADTWTDNTNVIYSIVDSGSTPVDPFGGTGNRSLRIAGGTGKVPGALYHTTTNGVSGAGRFTVKWRVASGYSYIRLRQLNPLSSDAVALMVYKDGTLHEDISGGVTFDQAFLADNNYTLVINFDTNTDKWSGTLNGVPLTSGSGAVSQWTFGSAVDSIGSAYLFTYDATASESFFDNLKIEHEPYLLDEDFNSLVVDDYTPPVSGSTDTYGDVGGYNWADTENVTYSIVDSGSTPADPFGGTENRSLRIAGGAGKVPGVHYKGNIDIFKFGRFSLNWRVASGYSYIRLRQLNPSSSEAVALIVYKDGTLREDISGGVTFDQTFSTGSNYILNISFDVDKDKWSGTLNDITLTSGGGTVSEWNFWHAVDNIGAAYLFTYDSVASESFFDNLKMTIPPDGFLMIIE